MAWFYFNKESRPPWLDGPEPENANSARGWKYYRHLWRAQPDWADTSLILAVYRERNERKARGEDVVVDHIVPLNGTLVCGLHVHYNLQVITRRENELKGNHTWPDMPYQQIALPLSCDE